MSRLDSRTLFLVLASKRAFEALTGPIPNTLKTLFRFQKPRHGARIRALLPDCRIVISKSYARSTGNRWIFEARRLGIPTLLLVDGPLEWANLYAGRSRAELRRVGAAGLFEPIIHDAVATIGKAQTDWIGSRNEGRGIELMSYANRRIQTRTGLGSDPSPPKFDFLITSAKTPYFEDREKADLAVVLAGCGAALERGGHRTLVRIFDGELRAAIRSAAPSCCFDIEGSFAEALSRTRCVIGTPSSVLLESMQHDKPTGLLMFRDSPLFYQTGWLLGCREDWNSSFASMLERDPARMELQRQTLRDNLSKQDFFGYCQKIADGEFLSSPRPFDLRDLEFENRVLRSLLGWRARWLAPILRAQALRRRRDR